MPPSFPYQLPIHNPLPFNLLDSPNGSFAIRLLAGVVFVVKLCKVEVGVLSADVVVGSVAVHSSCVDLNGVSQTLAGVRGHRTIWGRQLPDTVTEHTLSQNIRVTLN